MYFPRQLVDSLVSGHSSNEDSLESSHELLGSAIPVDLDRQVTNLSYIERTK